MRDNARTCMMPTTPKGLSISDVVNVTVNLAPLATVYRNFGAMMILGSSNVIDVNERFRQYSTIDEVTADFGTTAPEYKAAELFFEQSPKPAILYVGRWAQYATPSLLHGRVLSPAQQILANFTFISAGTLTMLFDGVATNFTGINLSTVLNLNGAASALQAVLAATVPNTRVTWDAVQQRFTVTNGSTGSTSLISYAQPTADGDFTFSTNPSPGESITLNGTQITFVDSGAIANQVNLGPNLTTTLQNLASVCSASGDPNISQATYSVDATHLYVVSKAYGTAGNAFTLASTAGSPSGGTLAGGLSTDIALLFGLDSGAPAPVQGADPESALDCVTTLGDASNLWYGVTFATLTPPTLSDYLAIGQYIEASQITRLFGITTNDPAVLDSTTSADIASQLKSLGLAHTMIQYSSNHLYAVASIMGRMATIDFLGSNTVITLKFKQQPGVVAEFISESQASTLGNKNCNVFVAYSNGASIIQEGVMCNGYFIDERHGSDWLQNQVQNDLFNVLYQSSTKVPQTDAGIHILYNAVAASLSIGITNGFIAPGVWNAAGFGQLRQGDTLTNGFYIFAPPIALQSQATREQRIAPTLQVAVKLSGAVHTAGVQISINR
jgi:hypothetical protein